MAPTHPSREQIPAMRRKEHFGERRPRPPADPVTPTQMFLEITRIKAYDRNPRRERNPLYDEIKDSIRAQGGLNTPFTITRRPGEALYTVESGGNTRLTALHELWSETRDERFYRIHCLFRPWASESHVLTAHLIENDKRGALTFIDKALAVRDLRNLLQAERRHFLTQRQLGEALRASGYGTDQSMISRMEYAVDVLLPLIPEALRAGMGARQIRRLRRIETACREWWGERGQPEETFTALFCDVLAAHDGPAWDPEAAQRELEQRLAAGLALSIKEIRLEVDARLARGTDEQYTVLVAESAASVPTSQPSDSATASSSAVYEGLHADPADRHSVATRASTIPDRAQTSMPPSPPTDIPSREAAMPVPSPSPDEGPVDVKSLRRRAYVLALKIVRRHGLEECLSAAPNFGMGYLVDLPAEPIIPVAGQSDPLSQRFRQWLWWLLLSLSEEAVDPARMASAPEGLRLRTLILERNDAQALALVGEPDWKSLGHELLSNPAVPDETLDDLLALIQTCRRLRRRAEDTIGASLWQAVN